MSNDGPSAPTESDQRRKLLQRQLGIAWSFAEDVVLPGIDHDRCLWQPSGHVVTVHSGSDGWVADWPDEEHPPLPEVTIGWLLWHVEWWWTNASRAVRGEELLPPAEHRWSGSTSGVLDCKNGWDQVLGASDLDRQVTRLMPEPESLAFVAAWVNFELTKNLSEINQLLVRYDNA